MSKSTHYLLTADFEALYRFYTHPVTGRFTATVCVYNKPESVETHDIEVGRKLWRSMKAGGGMVVSRDTYIDYVNNVSV